jgi:hypothetical protein
LIYRLKRFHLNDYLFLEPTTLLIVVSVITVNFILFFQGVIDFHFPRLEIEIYIIEVLLKTLSIFIGIVFSFIILSFNIFYKNFGRLAFINFFKNKSVKILFTLFVTTIVFMIYSLAYLNEIDISDYYAKSLFSLSITFCIVTVFSIFPAIINILKESQNRVNIHKLIQQLNTDWIISYHENLLWDKKLAYKHYQNDPITLLTEIGTNAIKEFDRATLIIMMDGCEDFLYTSIKQESNKAGIEPKKLYYEFGTLINNLFQVAIKERNESAMFLFLDRRFAIEKAILLNNEIVKLYDFHDKYHGWTFKYDMQDFFRKAIQNNEDDVCRRLIDSYREFITIIIIMVLPDRKFDYDFDDMMQGMDEKSMISEVFSEVDDFLTSIINKRKYHLFQNISALYSALDLVSIDSKNTNNSKVFLLNILNNYKLDGFNKFIVNSDIRNLSMSFYPFTTSTSHALREIGCSIPFKYSLKAIDILFANGRLNTMVINSLKADTFFLIQNIAKNKVNKGLLTLSIEKFDHLRSMITESDSDYKKDMYIQLKKFLNYIHEEAGNLIPTETETLELIKNKLTLFVLYDKFKKELDEKGYISNDSIV